MKSTDAKRPKQLMPSAGNKLNRHKHGKNMIGAKRGKHVIAAGQAREKFNRRQAGPLKKS